MDPDVQNCRECERNRRAREVAGPRLIVEWLGNMPWMEQAACRGFDPELWFPETGSGRAGAVPTGRKARAICFTCPVQRECFDVALARKEPHGIWGGFGAKFRADLASKRAGDS